MEIIMLGGIPPHMKLYKGDKMNHDTKATWLDGYRGHLTDAGLLCIQHFC